MKRKNQDEGRYSKVSRRMWGDSNFQALSKAPPNAQSLWQRLLTGPELGCVPGLFPARIGGLADALDWSKEDTQRCWEEIASKGMAEADWTAGLVWVPNAIAHNEPANPNVVTGWRLALCEMPECALKHKAVEELRSYLETMGENWLTAFDTMQAKSATVKASPNPSPKLSGKQEQETRTKEEREFVESALDDSSLEESTKTETAASAARTNDAKTVFEAWKQDTGHTQAKLDNKRLARIKARLKDGFTVEQLIQAIKNRRFDSWLMGTDSKSHKVYDGIETLLRDTAQVEKLLDLYQARPKQETTVKKVPIQV